MRGEDQSGDSGSDFGGYAGKGLLTPPETLGENGFEDLFILFSVFSVPPEQCVMPCVCGVKEKYEVH